MSPYREDPFQKLVNVNWGGSWAVLAWESTWQAAEDNTNNPEITAPPALFHLYDLPANVIAADGTRLVHGIIPFRTTVTEEQPGPSTTTTTYTLNVFFDSGPDHSVGFGFLAFQVVDNNTGTTTWFDSVGNSASSLEALVTNDGWTSYVVTNVSDPDTDSSAEFTLFTVTQNTMVFFKLSGFRAQGLDTLDVFFNSGNNAPPTTNESIPGFYKWRARLATFRGMAETSFTHTADDKPLDWFLSRAVSTLTKSSPDDGNGSQLEPTNVHFAINLDTLAVQ